MHLPPSTWLSLGLGAPFLSLWIVVVDGEKLRIDERPEARDLRSLLGDRDARGVEIANEDLDPLVLIGGYLLHGLNLVTRFP
jgi:hypothetical protein